MKKTLLACGVACLLLSTPALGANGKLPPMDAAAAADRLPDTVTPDGMHVGSWSASHPSADPTAGTNASRAAPEAPPSQQGHLPDMVTENGIHVGSWSASKPAAGTPATAPQTQSPPQPRTADASGENGLESHSMTVTSIQSCYDQLDPADAAEIKKNFLKPYAECHSRLEAKAEGKRELKQGEIQKGLTPESPRNYIRVQAPGKIAADAPNPPEKSGRRPNP